MDAVAQGKGRFLAELVQKALDSGQSSRSIAARANRAGHDLSHSYVNNASRELVKKPPTEAMIQALADGLAVDVSEVRQAVLKGWYDYDEPTTVSEGVTVITVPGSVTSAERDDLEALVRAFLASRRNG